MQLIASLFAVAIILVPSALVLRNSITGSTSESADVTSLESDSPEGSGGTIDSDLEAPVVVAPRLVSAVSPEGNSITVPFEVTAEDGRDGQLHPTCVPAPGSLFSVGATVVTCVAADKSGNVAVARIEVVVAVANGEPNENASTDEVLGVSLDSDGTSLTRLATAFALLGASFAVLGMGLYRRRAIDQAAAGPTS